MTEQVRAIRLRPTLGTVLDSATNSDGEIFFDSNNQTLRIFDNGTSALVATRTWTTSSISTAIAAIPASSITNDDINWIPYDQLIDLPSASANHGMFAHVHGTGKAYYAHAGAWIELANASDLAEGSSADPEYNNGAIIDLVGDGSNFFSREVTTNGVRIVAAGAVGGQTAVPDAFVEKVARMFELFTDVNGAGINEASQRTFIKTLSGDAGTYHAAVGPALQRVARGAGSDYTPNFLTDSGIASYNLSPLFDSHVANDMVWYLNSTGAAPGDGDNDAQEVIEHVFHTLHMHGLDAVSLKMYSYITADWASGPLYAAMEEAYDAGKWDSSGYGGNAWKTDGDAFEVAAKEYLFLLNFGMFEYSSLWDGGSLSPEWTDDMRTQSGIQANNPLGYALHNTYIAPVISKPSLTTIRSIFQDGDVGDPTVAGASGYVVDVVSGGSGIALTDLSVGAAASASGSGAIAYNNTTGVFTYTPPDLSTYLSSVAFSDLTSTPTTVAGYGITDAFDGVFGSLTSTPTTVAGYGITDIATTVTTAIGSSNLTDFSDVTITTPSDGQVLKYSSGQWVNAADLTGAGGSGISLSDLSVSVNAAGTANLAYNNVTGVFAYTPPNLSSYLTAITSSNVTTALGYTPLETETNDLSTAVTWANIPDANVPESAVTQHQAALSITESQISDLGTYLTTVGVLSNHTDVSATVPGTGQVLKWSGTEWAPAADALGEGGSGIALTDLSVGAAASASGSGAIAYNSSTGVFTYTPPLLSTYATTASLATVATSGAYSDLSGTPSIPVATLPAITKLTVTANGSSAYRFDQYGTADDPTIYAISATTIAFDLTGASGHPFLIQTSGGANYDTGLVHIDTNGTTTSGASAQGKSSGTLYWKIPIGTTGNYQYKCQVHGAMLGVITIKDFVTL